jgi:hypothetical protein
MKYRTSLPAAVLLALATVLPQATTAQTPVPPASTAHAPSTLFGLQITPDQNQTGAQQASDEQACYQSAKSQSGVDPATVSHTTPNNTSGTNAAMGSMAGGLAGLLGQAQTQYQQAPAQTQQGHPMKAFKKAFKQCMKSKGYSVKANK